MEKHIANSAGIQNQLCLASSLILNERPMPIRFFYKELPQHENDTGFRFYSGLESDEFLMSEDAALVAPIDCMIRLDESIKEFIANAEIGNVWERLPGKNNWIPVTDYSIPEI